jgi:FtsP/CotA-like multicopper oxidase with cupredoxin domain
VTETLQSISRKTWIASIVMITVTAVLVVLIVSNVFLLNSSAPAVKSSSKTVYYTIVLADKGPSEGMNGSAFHLSSVWPSITVQEGETVVINLVNENSSEPHGFSIFHYFNQGVALEPGGTYTVKFVANDPGTFLITCPIFCTIHPLMDHGEFIVQANSTAS